MIPTWPHSMRPPPGTRPPTNKGSFLWFLREFFSTHLDPDLNFKISKGEHGLEIISKTNNLGSLKANLHGLGRVIPSKLQDDTDSRGRQLDRSLRDYPSKIEVDGKVAAFWGPLALVNHDCGAKLEFELLDAEREVREGTDYHWGVKRRDEAGNGGSVTVGEPVEVYYGTCLGESDFICRSCQNQTQ